MTLVGSLSGAGSVSLSSCSSKREDNTSTTFSGVISGDGGLTRRSGTWNCRVRIRISVRRK